MKVFVCTWDPMHTVGRIEGQVAAAQAGVFDKLRERAKSDSELRALVAQTLKERNLNAVVMRDGEPTCPECDAFLEGLLSGDGVNSVLDAVREIALNPGAAYARTRRAKDAGI